LSTTIALLGLSPGATRVAESLYVRQPATAVQLIERTGLPSRSVRAALERLRELGVLRGGTPLTDGRPGYVWLDLTPAVAPLLEVLA
jgi:DNA-binding MarR family transcriptional regulator